jgi:hypothetical protein
LKIRQTTLWGDSVPLVQISMPLVKISILQLQLQPGTSHSPSDAACKCHTAQHYIFKNF